MRDPMGSLVRNLRSRGRLLSVALAAIVAASLVGGSVFGANAASSLITLGSTSTRPSCPSVPCQAVGKVSGFQISSGKHRGVFVAPASGKIVKWSIRLAKPGTKKSGKNPSQVGFFNSFYGTPAKARIAVIRRSNGKASPPKYKLVRQSPVETLTSYFGRTVTFVLAKPLSIHKGAVVALSIPTWAPAFAVDISNTNVWRASRGTKKCDKVKDIKAGSAQQTVGKSRTYGCVYKGAKLVYSAGLAKG